MTRAELSPVMSKKKEFYSNYITVLSAITGICHFIAGAVFAASNTVAPYVPVVAGLFVGMIFIAIAVDNYLTHSDSEVQTKNFTSEETTYLSAFFDALSNAISVEVMYWFIFPVYGFITGISLPLSVPVAVAAAFAGLLIGCCVANFLNEKLPEILWSLSSSDKQSSKSSDVTTDFDLSFL